MKAVYFLPLVAFLLTGCMPDDPETRLYSVVKSNPEYTIYNCPSIILTSKEQQVRANKQAESIRDNIKIGMDDYELAELWGKPNEIKKSTYPGGRVDTFIYESTGGRYMTTEDYYFVFRDRKLESWHRM